MSGRIHEPRTIQSKCVSEYRGVPGQHDALAPEIARQPGGNEEAKDRNKDDIEPSRETMQDTLNIKIYKR